MILLLINPSAEPLDCCYPVLPFSLDHTFEPTAGTKCESAELFCLPQKPTENLWHSSSVVET
jgi:hypothetical protein